MSSWKEKSIVKISSLDENITSKSHIYQMIILQVRILNNKNYKINIKMSMSKAVGVCKTETKFQLILSANLLHSF